MSIDNADMLEKQSLKPRAKVTQFSVASSEPIQLLDGHVLATQKLLEKQRALVATPDGAGLSTATPIERFNQKSLANFS